MFMPVVAIQLLLNEASEHTVRIRNQTPVRLLSRLKEILTNIILLSRAQEWCATYHLIHSYSRQFTTAQVLLVEEVRAALAERFDGDYEIQQQRFMIIRQLGIGHVLLYREVNYFFNAALYLAFTARETVHDFRNDLRSLTWYFSSNFPRNMLPSGRNQRLNSLRNSTSMTSAWRVPEIFGTKNCQTREREQQWRNQP